MVDWQSPAEQLKDALAFENLIYSLFGLYAWEVFLTCEFEWSLITRRRKFTWPMARGFLKPCKVLYFLCRYCMLFALVGIIISFTVTTKVNCQALYVFNSWTGNMAILCATTSLMIRTIAIWERKLVIVAPLLVLALGHWGLLYHGIIIVSAEWSTTENACVVNTANPTFLTVNFFYTLCFDMIILVCTTVALMRNSNRSGLWKLLFRDGLAYWAISFCANAIPAILNVLHLNTTMNIIGTVPAATVSSIAACRCLVRLQDFSNANVELYVQSQSFSGNGGTTSVARFAGPKPPRYPRPEVQITTDHITMENLDGRMHDLKAPDTYTRRVSLHKKTIGDIEEESYSEDSKATSPADEADLKYNAV